jgi:endonuclease G, mitochondrial
MKVTSSGPPSAKTGAAPTSKLAAVLAKRASAATQSVSIADVEKRFGWKPGSWQDTLLTSADAAGNKDKQVNKTEIERYLRNPKDAKFISSAMLQSMSVATAGGGKRVSDFKGAENTFAAAADKNRNGSVTLDEFASYSADVKNGSTKTKWIADQQASMFGSSVASTTGESDALLAKGFKGPVLDRGYMRIIENENKLNPDVVSYTLTAADIAQSGQVARKNNFRADPDWKPSPTKADYNNTGFDRGHMKPANDSPNAEAMSESFLMTNMAPQHGALNQAAWRYLEAGLNELVQATDGKATVHTGNLYLDSAGNPLDASSIDRIGSGSTKIAVPTHNFKSILLETPDGKKQLMSFIVPNRSDLARDKSSGQKVLHASRVSTNKLEQMLGNVNLFPTLTTEERKSLKGQATPSIRFEGASKFPYAQLLWPQ